MIKMTEKELWKRWENHYTECGIDKKYIVKDGIINEKEFSSASIKILFVLKEVNGWDKGKDIGGDLRIRLKNGPVHGTWFSVARLSAGIFNGFPKFEDIDNESIYNKEFSKIAGINMKKIGGGGSSNMHIINEFAYRSRKLLKMQIESINPDIIISCGVFDSLIWLFDLNVTPTTEESTKEPVKTKINGKDCWIIPFRHPLPLAVSSKTLYKNLRYIMFSNKYIEKMLHKL